MFVKRYLHTHIPVLCLLFDYTLGNGNNPTTVINLKALSLLLFVTKDFNRKWLATLHIATSFSCTIVGIHSYYLVNGPEYYDK